jgi:uncharacterized repeat protein (TIGR02543 family)
MFLVAFFGTLLCAGLFTGCDEVKDLFHPEGPSERVVTFNLQEGNINGVTTTRKVSVKNGDSVGSAMPSNPSRDGYTFDGWWTAPSGGSQFTSSTEVTEDITVYARWTTGGATTRTVTFDLQGGNISGTTANQTRTVDNGSWLGATNNMPSNPSRSGYTFDGWWTATNGGGDPFTAYTTVSANITVYAYWTTGSVTTRTVTFDLQGGSINNSIVNQTKTVDYGSWLGSNMPSNPIRDGYTFDGWWTAPNGGGELFTSYTTVSASITVYAKWTPGSQSSSGITNISYSSVSGGEWILQGDGSRKSPTTSHGTTAKARISFTSTASASITILLTVSSESGCDWAFIGQLDNASATSTSGSYQSSVISGDTSVTLIIPISSAGSHSIDIGYSKDGSINSGSDCAWFTVIGGEEEPILPSNLSLAASLAWISNNAVAGGAYTITVNNNETIAPTTLYYSVSNVSISIVGGNTERTISLSSSGSLFTIESGVTLTLGNNVSLQGRSSNTASLVRVNIGGTLVMENGSKISGNSNISSDGGGVFVGNGSTFTQNDGTISGNSANRGGGVYVDSSGTFFKQMSGTIYGSNASDTQKNTATSDNGHAVYVSGSPSKLRNSTADLGVILNSAVSGTVGGWEDPTSMRTVTFDLQGGNISGATAQQTRTVDYGSWLGDNMPSNPSRDGYTFDGWWTATDGGGTQFTAYTTVSADITVYAYWMPDTQSLEGISNISYSSVSGGEWIVQPDGRRESPAIGHGGVTKARVSFTSTAGASITIQLTVSSESGYDYAFISQLDNGSATHTSGFYTGSVISGAQTVTLEIPIPTAGSHFIDIGYSKDGSQSNGDDCTRFMVLEPSHSMQINLQPVSGEPTLFSVPSFFANAAANFSVDNVYTDYTWYWNGNPIGGATSSTYTIEANTRTPGVYELSVVVTTSAGAKLSARCRVVVKTN